MIAIFKSVLNSHIWAVHSLGRYSTLVEQWRKCCSFDRSVMLSENYSDLKIIYGILKELKYLSKLSQ